MNQSLIKRREKLFYSLLSLLFIILLLGMLSNRANAQTAKASSMNPESYGFSISKIDCDCNKDNFYNTTVWKRGTRSGFYCIATSSTGNKYKRYFSNWVKVNERRKSKGLEYYKIIFREKLRK